MFNIFVCSLLKLSASSINRNTGALGIGSQPHASEVLNRQRPLTLPMIRVLSAEWDLPADILVREYDLTTTA